MNRSSQSLSSASRSLDPGVSEGVSEGAPEGWPEGWSEEGHHHPSRRSHRLRKWHRIWPQSIPGRLLAMLAVGLLMVQSLTGILYWSDRQLNTNSRLIETVGDRMVAIATLLKSTPADQQLLAIQALNGPLLQVDALADRPDYLQSVSPGVVGGRRLEGTVPLHDGPHDRLQDRKRPKPDSLDPNSNRGKDRRKPGPGDARRLGRKQERRLQQLHDYLTQSLESPVFVMVRPTLQLFSPPPVRPLSFGRLLPSRHRLTVVVEEPSQWLVFTIPVGFGSQHHGPRFPLIMLTTGVVIWLLFAWATRRITNPLLDFTTAADRLGLDVNAPPLPEHGSRELRQAAQAFNRMQERLQRLIGDRTFMLAAISHDLRTILTRLRLRTELMDDSTQRQKVQEDLSQMEMMLHSTLAFAKEDSTPEARQTIDISSLVQSVCDDLSDNGYRIACDSGDRIPLQGQPTALRRAFTNLIENAATYGQVAEVSIISVVDKSGAKGVEVAIADQGPGIPPNMREQVFKPFFRLEQSRNRDTGGTGLGMAVARTVIRRHGGTIRLQNYPNADAMEQPNGGLLVTVTLPGQLSA